MYGFATFDWWICATGILKTELKLNSQAIKHTVAKFCYHNHIFSGMTSAANGD